MKEVSCQVRIFTANLCCCRQLKTHTHRSILIASKLDLDIHANTCRLAFWGKYSAHYRNSYRKSQLTFWKIYKHKQKEAQFNVWLMHRRESNRQLYVGKQLKLLQENVVALKPFGQTSKF
ncbi:hypothetical protein DOY81_011027 [Sarcophaga bullata]|nr:hypothetical protein DOY81_011027 [Sarcophaga bullata]